MDNLLKIFSPNGHQTSKKNMLDIWNYSSNLVPVDSDSGEEDDFQLAIPNNDSGSENNSTFDQMFSALRGMQAGSDCSLEIVKSVERMVMAKETSVWRVQQSDCHNSSIGKYIDQNTLKSKFLDTSSAALGTILKMEEKREFVVASSKEVKIEFSKADRNQISPANIAVKKVGNAGRGRRVVPGKSSKFTKKNSVNPSGSEGTSAVKSVVQKSSVVASSSSSKTNVEVKAAPYGISAAKKPATTTVKKPATKTVKTPVVGATAVKKWNQASSVGERSPYLKSLKVSDNLTRQWK